MKVLRVVSDGRHTHLDIDGKEIGEDIKTVVFIHDINGKHFDGYERPVLQLIDKNGVAFDSRFDVELPDYNEDDAFDRHERLFVEAGKNGTFKDDWWLV